jgi:predicted ATPase with chaperone activity
MKRCWRRGVGLKNLRTNAEAPAAVLEEIARPDRDAVALLRDAADALRLSARGYHRVLRVALTLADLDGADTNRLVASGGSAVLSRDRGQHVQRGVS